MADVQKYKGYHIFKLKFNKFKWKIVSYAKDFKPHRTKTLKEAKIFINKKLGVK